MSFISKKQLLEEINYKIKNCNKCPLAKYNRTHVVGRGNIESDILFIGEAPGAEEDRLGIPFVGRSGRLLEKIFNKIGLTENDYYITNVVNCRPPENRNPFYDEILICSTYLIETIEVMKPRLIITLGRVAGDWYSNFGEYTINEYVEEKKWLPLYHPSYLLRNPAEREEFEKILQEKTRSMKNEN